MEKRGFFMLRFRESADLCNMNILHRKRQFLKGIILFGIVTLIFGVHYVLPYGIVSRQVRPIAATPAQFELYAEKTVLTTREGLQLRGYWVYPKIDQPKAVIILHHGIGGGKEQFYTVAQNLTEQGIACIIYDSRAHGESEGEYITYGYYEKYDVSDVVHAAQKKYPLLPIGIWGNSMGGAIALQALEIEPELDFGIIESTFTNLNDIVSDYQTRYTAGLRMRWISDYALERAGNIAQFNPVEVYPLRSAMNIKQPVFLAHGTADPNINFVYGEQLAEKLITNTNSEFYPVKGGNHYNLLSVGGEAYQNHINQFIQKMIDHNL